MACFSGWQGKEGRLLKLPYIEIILIIYKKIKSAKANFSKRRKKDKWNNYVTLDKYIFHFNFKNFDPFWEWGKVYAVFEHL